MLLKEYRLRKRSAFTATYRTNTSYHETGITVFCGKKKIDNNMVTKIGFVVSKKVHKRAVKRNRIKRIMRESVRLYIKGNNLNTKFMSLIFVANNKTLNMNYNEIDSSINKLMSKIYD